MDRSLKHSLLKKTEDFFDAYIDSSESKSICVALSGGADSVSLLLAMKEVSKNKGFLISACHFNHMIRGEEAERDRSFCEKLCLQQGIPLFVGKCDVPAYSKENSVSLELAARECRYAFFESLAKREGIDLIATAHTMDDNAETVLLNIIRGSGSYGASGILPIRDIFVRPFLKVSRAEVEDFLFHLGQDFVTDSTNGDTSYTRNFLRLSVFPLLRNINPDVSSAISRYSDSAKNDRNYFDNQMEQCRFEDLRRLHPSLRDRFLYRSFFENIGRTPDHDEINRLTTALLSGRRRVLSFCDTVDTVAENGRIGFFPSWRAKKYPSEPLTFGNNIVFDGTVEISFSDGPKNTKSFNKISTTDMLSFDNIKGSLYVRSRSEGDTIRIKGVSKNVKKLFVDKKIPKEFRDNVPVFCDDEGIIYIPFLGIADRVYSKERCKTAVATVFHGIDTERWRFAYETEK